ncbi:hypothetical protein V8B55DRAFT_1410423 [Mucor lusitanicus]|uniref:Uncharacterized protein n=1 Tax=Mucor lusitanicus CBS 277.49 TaxID=747725 RepID=A0A168HZ51_MUCCL|nr:hypothetical protein MUCCIDRAFT_190943 [Mucor lusitanicus CBS 277.49]
MFKNNNNNTGSWIPVIHAIVLKLPVPKEGTTNTAYTTEFLLWRKTECYLEDARTYPQEYLAILFSDKIRTVDKAGSSVHEPQATCLLISKALPNSPTYVYLNGIECSRFCHDYIMKIRKSANPATQSLDTGGHTYSDGLALTNMTGQ